MPCFGLGLWVTGQIWPAIIQKTSKEHQRTKVLACCVVGRCWEHELLAGQLGQVRVLKWMLCLIQLAFCSISSTRNYLDPSASWQANLHPAHYCTNLKLPQAPQIARTNQRLWWFVVINHAKLEVPTLTHTHAPTRFSQLPFWAPSQSCSFQHLSTHFLAPECHPFFLEANQRNGLSPVCFTVRQSSFRGAGAMLGPGPDWTLAPSWAGLGAATSQKFELHGRVSNFWILHLIHLIFPDLLATHWRNHQRTWFLDFGSWSLSPTLKYRTSLHPKFLGLSYGLSGSGTSGSGAWPGAFCTRQRP